MRSASKNNWSRRRPASASPLVAAEICDDVTPSLARSRDLSTNKLKGKRPRVHLAAGMERLAPAKSPAIADRAYALNAYANELGPQATHRHQLAQQAATSSARRAAARPGGPLHGGWNAVRKLIQRRMQTHSLE
jgi:hypothetical protein